jgi:hypothetical protein
MTYFEKFSLSEDPIVKHTADILEQITVQYQSKVLTLKEYKELVDDLLDYGHVCANINDVVRRKYIAGAFQSLVSIVSTIT